MNEATFFVGNFLKSNRWVDQLFAVELEIRCREDTKTWRSDVGKIPRPCIIIFNRDGQVYRDVVTQAG